MVKVLKSSDQKIISPKSDYYNDPKAQAYGKWLGQYDWDYFCTFTTRYQLTLPSARRLMWRFWDMKELKTFRSSRLFWAAEPFDTRVGYHTHALLKVPEGMPFKMLTEIYQVAAGNVSLSKSDWHRVQFKPYNKNLGATYYCGKYITKRLADYDMWTQCE